MATLEKISIKGFKSIKELTDFDLKNLNILIGPNGAGKSNFILVFKMLNYMVQERLQMFVGRAGGADNLLHFGQKFTNAINIKTESTRNAYECILAPSEDDKLFFQEESSYFFKGDYTKESKNNYGSGHFETALHKYSRDRKAVPYYVIEMLQSWVVYHFHDTSASAKLKLTGNVNDGLYLHADAGNLAARLNYLKTNHPEYYKRIVNTIRLAAPFFDDFQFQRINSDNLRFVWRHKDSIQDFYANSLSDGTLRFICLATLLLQPGLPSVILLDEPELGLHPYAMDLLAGMMRSASKKTQVIASTQSVTLVNKFKAEDIIVVERQEGQTTFERQSLDNLQEWLGNYGMGDLWEKNVLGGRP